MFESVDWIKVLNGENPKVIFDVGCYDGSDALAFKRRFPEAQVHAFEAAEDVYKSNTIRCANSGIFYHWYAVTDRDGFTEFIQSVGALPCSGSIYDPTPLIFATWKQMTFKEKVKVPCISLSTFCKENHIEHINILHIDVQGAEKLVIAGMGNIISDIIFAETDAFKFYHTGITKDNFDEFILSKGYQKIADIQGDSLYSYKGIKA